MYNTEREVFIEETIARFEQLQHDAAKIATAMLELNNVDFLGREIDPEDVVCEDGIIRAQYTQKFGCDYEDNSIEVPIEHLVDDEWYEAAKVEVLRKKIEQARKAEERRLETERAKEAAEYRNYLDLKAKFEGDNNEKG